jgi:hypothetical protein
MGVQFHDVPWAEGDCCTQTISTTRFEYSFSKKKTKNKKQKKTLWYKA